MRAAPTLLLPLTALLLAGAPAKAEFVVADSYDSSATASTPEAGGAETAAPRLRRAAPPAIPVAQGFGEGVPLRFALRQIVPARARVELADGVDPDLPVDWRGGRRWDRVLADAVAPLGLRLVPAPRGGGGGWVLRP